MAIPLVVKLNPVGSRSYQYLDTLSGVFLNPAYPQSADLLPLQPTQLVHVAQAVNDGRLILVSGIFPGTAPAANLVTVTGLQFDVNGNLLISNATLATLTSPSYEVFPIKTPGGVISSVSCLLSTGKSPSFIVGIINNSFVDQPIASNITFYDNTSASGKIVYSLGSMPASQVTTFPSPGLPISIGLTAMPSGLINGDSIGVMIR